MVRGEVEIDVCPRCRGVWLDRGEIDKLAGTGRMKPRPKRSDSKRYEPRKDRDDRDDKKRREDRRRRRKSFGEKIADVFDDILD